jgi:queuine tRNA-ribosyltransferase
MSSLSFTLQKKSTFFKARTGKLLTAHGGFDTPMFMPVGTRGSVKALLMPQLKEVGAKIILGNTYHLMLRPGVEIIEQAGGLHSFIDWDGPILTDSGGFQVFSLSNLRTIEESGVAFRSHIDGSSHFLGPCESMAFQRALGADIVMCFDECPASSSSLIEIEKAVERTLRWAQVCRNEPLKSHQNLFAIVQGGLDANLRRSCAQDLTKLDFEGFAIGGLSVGESSEEMYRTIEVTEPFLPEDKPRYLMGVGTPRNILEAVLRGVDLFDCVLPTRNARRGTAFTWQGKVMIKAGRYANDDSVLDETGLCYASTLKKSYIRHLCNVGEISAMTLLTMQNLAFYLDFMKKLREAIAEDRLEAFIAMIDTIYPNKENI